MTPHGPSLAAQFATAAKRQREAAILAYSLLLSAAEAGQPVDPIAAVHVLQAMGKTLDVFSLDLTRSRASRNLQALIDGARQDLIADPVRAEEANAESRRLIEQLNAEIFGSLFED